jgi:dipeptidyl aminopeptidase/acylaminoacyl peptidase
MANQSTSRTLFRLRPREDEFTRVLGSPEQIYSASLTPDGRTVALLAADRLILPELFITSLSDGRLDRKTHVTRQTEGWPLGTRDVIQWKSKDGVVIEGILWKPEGFDPDARYPLLVQIHGGPTGISRPVLVASYVYPLIQWLAKGALILQPNYRGSAGYGEKFRSLNVRNLGVGDLWDVESGVDHLIEMGWVDPARVGAMGWSQGGYISAFLATNSEKFRAISVGAGISNWVTYYVNTDIHPFTRQYLQATPWEDMEVYRKTSPMTNIINASTPTMIQHGEFDRRVPIPNAYELLQGLRDVGVETKLIVYKGFGHGIGKPKERLAAIWHNWEWFATHMWGESVRIPLEKE